MPPRPSGQRLEDLPVSSQSEQEENRIAERQDVSLPDTTITVIRQRNIRIILTYTWIVFAGRSIWNQNVLATFCFLLENGDPKSVGYLTAAMGLSQLIVSFPVGYLADRYRRDHLLKVASCMGIVAAGTTLKVLFWNDGHHPTYGNLVLALCLWGCFWGIANTCLSAVFADSMDQGERSQYFTKRSILINFGMLSGPTVALSMFLILGNEWTIMDCAHVMGAGQIICLPAMVLLCFLKDPSQSRQERQERHCDYTDQDQDNTLHTPLLSQAEEDERRTESSSTTSDTTTDASPSTTTRPHRDETYDAAKLSIMLGCFHGPPKRIIPALVASADVLAGLASGMSIRYFAIFLYDNLHLKPVHVQILYMIAPVLQAGLAKWGQLLAKSYGRCTITVTFKWIGISFMMAMIGMTKWNEATIDKNDRSSVAVVAMICTLLVIRTAFMNSTSALTKSVLMDHVPNNERAKWSALESFNMFSWSGSAALGGILVDYHGILFNFCITATLQLVATLPHVFLARAAVRTTNGSGEQDAESNAIDGQQEAQNHRSHEVDRIGGDNNNTDGQDRIETAV